MSLETPSKPSRRLPFEAGLGKKLASAETSDDDDVWGNESDIDEESPWKSETPGAAEIQNTVYEQTRDEQIVNAALVSFLSALTLHSGLRNRWTLHRKPLKAEFENAAFEARTDGYLADKGLDTKVRALVEVKAAPRLRKRKVICMQEAAQMVAWLKTEPDLDGSLNKPGRRLHVSQDRHQIFIVVAEYSEKYIEYLRTGESSDAFLTMNEFGPWNTTIAKDMENLAPIVVAIALRAAEDHKAEERNKP